VAWLPHNEVGASPAQLFHVREGTYKGQLLIAENTYGGIQRLFVEKVDGEYQGSVFRFTGGLEVGPQTIKRGPDGALYVGGLGPGTDGNWGWRRTKFGLQKLVPKGEELDYFEILAVRSRNNGMEMEFTIPAGPSAEDGSRYLVKRWRYEQTANYGGPKLDVADVTIRSITMSEDRKKAFLELEGLREGHVIYFKLNGVMSQSGKELWDNETWYNLNTISQSEAFAVNGCTDPAYLEYDPEAAVDDGSCQTAAKMGCMDSNYLEFDSLAEVADNSMCETLNAGANAPVLHSHIPVRMDPSGAIFLASPFSGPVTVSVRDAGGRFIIFREFHVPHGKEIRVDGHDLDAGILFITIEQERNRIVQRIIVY
jgi:hypothetical protein